MDPGLDTRLEAAETKKRSGPPWALSPRQRAAIVLRYYGDQSDTEMAAASIARLAPCAAACTMPLARSASCWPAWVRPSVKKD